jgi:hypothetical protein
MNTRIRFIYDGESQGKGKTRNNSSFAESRQLFKVGDKHVKLYLDLKNFYYEIVDVASNTLIKKGGNTKNVAVLLKQAKRGLKELGCTFDNETRKKEEVQQETETTQS